MKKTLTLATLGDTEALAATLGQCAVAGSLILLRGDLGTGKTAFVKAYARSVGVIDEVVSPTFVLEGEYHSSQGLLCHWDLYRLNAPGEDLLLEILEERDRGAIVFVEWSERLSRLRDYADLEISFFHHAEDHRRECVIEVLPRGVLQFTSFLNRCY